MTSAIYYRGCGGRLPRLIILSYLEDSPGYPGLAYNLVLPMSEVYSGHQPPTLEENT
jgi:hypothetical protein